MPYYLISSCFVRIDALSYFHMPARERGRWYCIAGGSGSGSRKKMKAIFYQKYQKVIRKLFSDFMRKLFSPAPTPPHSPPLPFSEEPAPATSFPSQSSQASSPPSPPSSPPPPPPQSSSFLSKSVLLLWIYFPILIKDKYHTVRVRYWRTDKWRKLLIELPFETNKAV